MEISRVSPVFEDGVKADPNNYRPISALPVVSKLTERVVFNQFYGYLNENNLLTESQSGFRPRFLTETTLLEETNEWIENIDKSLLNCLIFLDHLTPWTVKISTELNSRIKMAAAPGPPLISQGTQTMHNITSFPVALN